MRNSGEDSSRKYHSNWCPGSNQLSTDPSGFSINTPCCGSIKRACMAVHNSVSACCTSRSSRTDRVARNASARCISGFCKGPLPSDAQLLSSVASYRPSSVAKRCAITSSEALSTDSTSGSRTLSQ
ncbi:hypothetical protein D3C81_1590750 [compost metagenome]